MVADWPYLPRQHYCWRLCSMWAVLHPHSVDDFLLSALYCSSFFTVSSRYRQLEVTLQMPKHLVEHIKNKVVRLFPTVLSEFALRWSDRFQSVTKKEPLRTRISVWPQLPTANRKVRRFRCGDKLVKPTATSSGGALGQPSCQRNLEGYKECNYVLS